MAYFMALCVPKLYVVLHDILFCHTLQSLQKITCINHHSNSSATTSRLFLHTFSMSQYHFSSGHTRSIGAINTLKADLTEGLARKTHPGLGARGKRLGKGPNVLKPARGFEVRVRASR